MFPQEAWPGTFLELNSVKSALLDAQIIALLC